MYEGYISSSSGQGIAVSKNNGTTWTTYAVAPNPGTLADKNHLMIDKKPGSPYENRVYAAWTDFGGTHNYNVVVRYSTNFGETWSNSINLSSTMGAYLNQGVNVQTGPNGEVYASWAIYDGTGVAGGEDAIGFAKSTNGGVTWTAARIYGALTPNGNFNFGIRGNLKPTNIRVSSFPSMAVDRSEGPNNGYIYITWPQRGVSPAGTDPDIVMIKSTNGGTTWSAPLRVNNDPVSNARDQYYPWMTVDQVTGNLHFVFYDSRETTNDSSGVYMALSTNAGSTFENYRVSDKNFRPKTIPGLASGYQGDYIGIAALNNVAYPYWMDDRTGNYQGWMSKVSFGPPCPVETASNPFPAANADSISIYLPQISWTNGSGASQCEVWFGASGNMDLIYSGNLITSIAVPGVLNYDTYYSWKVVSKNDTCNVSVSWSFKTRLSPGIMFIETFQNTNNWTAAGPLGTTNWTTRETYNAGGSSPELRFYYSPTFDGLSKFVRQPVTVKSNHSYTLKFRHMVDWYANPAPFLGIGISYDNGNTYTSLWQIQPTGNVGPEQLSFIFTTPADLSDQTSNLSVVLYCDGNSFNLDYWYTDDVILIDNNPVISLPLSVNIHTGWNIVSIPGLHPVDQHINTWWSGRDQQTSVYSFTNEYTPVTVAAPGKGYWMKHTGNKTYNTGDEWPGDGITVFPNVPIAGNSGWNLIGGYNFNALVSGLTTIPSGAITTSVFGFSDVSGYIPVTALVPGYGYWIKLSQAAQILLPEVTYKGSAKIAAEVSQQWGKIILVDKAGRNYTLFIADGEADLNMFELPPAYPGMFDVRYGSQRYVEKLDVESKSIEFMGMEYPVSIKVENVSIKLQDETGLVVNTVLKPGEEILISRSEINKLLVSGNMVPDQYSLSQNYPNPFNPSTVIEFAIPEDASSVTLTIYDGLGQKVAELVNGTLQAGYYKYQWNASKVASGLYIYQLKAGKFISTRKMLLLK
jgi:hypothetical protein